MAALEVLILVTFLGGGVIISALCNKLLLQFSHSLGIRNKNDVVIRWSNQSKPSLGGVSFFVVFVFSTMAYIMFMDESNIFHNAAFGYQYTGLFIAACLAFLMGLADDAYNTRPYAKLIIQISCGIIMIITGTKIDVSHNFYFDSLLTIVWVIVVMNSLNMLDNMDGITGTTVVFIIISCLFANWFLNGLIFDIWTLTLLSVLGAVIGFLYYNLHPSKLFMGDAGSQFIGLFIAFFGIKFLLNIGAQTHTFSWASVIITLTAFTPAAADTLTVVINRLKKGQSPMVGGKDHTTHHLAYSGKSDKQVWIVFFTIGLISSALACLLIYLLKERYLLLIAPFLLYFILIFAYLYRNTLLYKSKSN